MSQVRGKAQLIAPTVASIMARDVISVTPKDTLRHALGLMRTNTINRLPVVKDHLQNRQKLVGIVSERDVRLAARSPVLAETKREVLESLEKVHVGDVMKTGVVTVEDTASIVDATKLMRVSHVGGLPVTDAAGNLVGMCTRTDLLDQLIRVYEPLDSGPSSSSDQKEVAASK
ncbi:Ribosomal protein S1 [Balamuthia mandrillaris]